MNDVRSTREAYDDGLIKNLGGIHCHFNPADKLTKFSSNLVMKPFVETVTLSYEVKQWVVRTPNDDNINTNETHDSFDMNIYYIPNENEKVGM